MVDAVRTPGPITALNDVIERFFAHGTVLASLRYHIAIQSIQMPLVAFLRGGPTMPPPPLPNDADLRAIFHSEKTDQAFLDTIARKYPWDSSMTAAEFTAMLCADLEDINARVRAVSFNSRALAGLPSLTQIRLEPSVSLVSAVSKAIAVQKGGSAGRAVHGGRTLPAASTCLIVSLTDCAMHKAAEQYNQSVVHYTSYGHNFALLVDSSGVAMYQAWGNTTSVSTSAGPSSGGALDGSRSASPVPSGSPTSEHHLTLDDWVHRARAPRPMTYGRALDFARTFDDFCERIAWDDATNGLYLQLFGVDLAALAEVTGLPPPARIKSWVRILEIPGVTAERIIANARFFL